MPFPGRRQAPGDDKQQGDQHDCLLQGQLAALKAEHKGKNEAGLGDSAISYVSDGSAVILALKGDQTFSLQAFDAGTSPAVFEKLRALMRKGMGE